MDYAVFLTRLGWMTVARSPLGVAAVTLPSSSVADSLDRLCVSARARPSGMHEVSPDAFGTLPERLAAFMGGEDVPFEDEIDRSGWTDFRSRVWEATRLVPYGETRSYAWVALTVGQPMACRAVGQALHHNPVPILVPCHRIIGADGGLTGFGSRLELKQALLSMEAETLSALRNAVR
jgi:methylated-DNA-[protein]-cysteine S-methyltransferase